MSHSLGCLNGKKKKENNNCWQGCGETSGWNVKWCSHHENFGSSRRSLVPQKAKYRITILPSNFTPKYTPKRFENRLFVCQCSLKHYSQWPKGRNNPSVH